MAMFARTFYPAPEPTFNGIFRVLDDFDTISREIARQHQARRQRVFNPRFDVRETDTTYELHGELPGVTRENISVEFTEPQTMVVKGRAERNYTAGTPPAAAAAAETQTQAPAAEAAEPEFEMVDAEAKADTASDTASHRATVTDEETEAAAEKGTEVEAQKPAEPEKKVQESPKERYWHSERSIGSFQRTFNFPARVDEDAVSASLENGILHVTIPKSAKHETRRINVA